MAMITWLVKTLMAFRAFPMSVTIGMSMYGCARQNADRDPAGFLGAFCGRLHDSASPSANQDGSLAANQVADFAGEAVYLRQA
jgi:hypothetical protein